MAINEGSLDRAVRMTLATVLETELIDGDRWVPLPTVADHGVEDDEQLPHAGDVGHLGRLPAVA